MRFLDRFFVACCCLWSTAAIAEIKTERVLYKEGEIELEGVKAYDTATVGQRPGVLIIHEWWGRNDYAERRARDYAALGYVAFALDMYGKGVTATTPDQAKKLSTPFYEDRNLFRRRAQAGLGILVRDALVDYSKLAVLGYCFGGAGALELARSGVDIDAVVNFHGGLSNPSPNDTKNIKASVLVLMGADDPYVPLSERTAFKAEMEAAGVKLEYVEYPGAVHAFTNPAVDALKLDGLAYNKSADTDSFNRSKTFLAAIFGQAE